jgi:hypothetical protein
VGNFYWYHPTGRAGLQRVTVATELFPGYLLVHARLRIQDALEYRAPEDTSWFLEP